jgi:hypothetical protein
VGFARLLAIFLPFRQRPLFNPDLHLNTAFTLDPRSFETWSSFPSDRGVLFFLLATGLYLVSRRLGWFMYIYTFVVILLPRLYLGVPSDTLVGMLLGLAIGWTIRIPALRQFVNRPAQRLLEYSPGLFYAILFQLSFQTNVYYDPLRQTVRSLVRNFFIVVSSIHRDYSETRQVCFIFQGYTDEHGELANLFFGGDLGDREKTYPA